MWYQKWKVNPKVITLSLWASFRVQGTWVQTIPYRTPLYHLMETRLEIIHILFSLPPTIQLLTQFACTLLLSKCCDALKCIAVRSLAQKQTRHTPFDMLERDCIWRSDYATGTFSGSTWMSAITCYILGLKDNEFRNGPSEESVNRHARSCLWRSFLTINTNYPPLVTTPFPVGSVWLQTWPPTAFWPRTAGPAAVQRCQNGHSTSSPASPSARGGKKRIEKVVT